MLRTCRNEPLHLVNRGSKLALPEEQGLSSVRASVVLDLVCEPP